MPQQPRAATRAEQRAAATSLLAQHMTRHGVTYQQVEEAAGLPRGAISGAVTGGRVASKAALWAWSGALGQIIATQSGPCRVMSAS